jgi:hypothetical protein
VSDPGARLEELGEGVLGPLVLGGRMTPVRPFGPRFALTFAAGRSLIDVDLRTRIDVARVRVARQLEPVDVLPDVSPAEWALAAAFNDLIQVTNHELSGPLTRSRHKTLLAATIELLRAIPPPRTPLEALCRHSLFSRVLEAFRTDSALKWWTGSAAFRGRPPSKRLAAWPELRRVHVDKTKVPFVKMVEGITTISSEDFAAAVGAFLALTPITDFASAARPSPVFRWSKGTLSLVGSPIGRSLAGRAIARGGAPLAHVRAALEGAARDLGPALDPFRPACEALFADLAPRDVEAARGR